MQYVTYLCVNMSNNRRILIFTVIVDFTIKSTYLGIIIYSVDIGHIEWASKYHCKTLVLAIEFNKMAYLGRANTRELKQTE